MPAEDRAISDFPIALQILNKALVLISNPDGQGGYDSYQATLTEIGRVVLKTQYTQDLGNVDVFDAIKNCRVLSGTTNPTSAQGVDGQMYVKYQTVSDVDEVVGLYVKLSGEWAEIATGGSGGDVGIECTQAQYDAWELAGTLLQDTNYYITDGQSGGGVTIDDTTASSTTVYSSDKVEDLLSDKADTSSTYTKTETNNLLSSKADTSAIPTKTSELNNDNNFITASGAPVQRAFLGYGTSLTTNFSKAQYLVFIGSNYAYLIWFAGSSTSTNISFLNIGANNSDSSTTGSVSQVHSSETVTFIRNSNGTLSVTTTASNTITILG